MLAGHALHSAMPTPYAVECFPNTQSRQTPAPNTALYLPGTQRRHGPPEGPAAPALQRQSVDRVLPRVESVCIGHGSHASRPGREYEPERHGRHTVAAVAASVKECLPSAHIAHVCPGPVLYLPGAHCVHSLCPEKPALHVQLTSDALPLRELALAGHDTHELRMSGVAEYEPAGHSWQRSAVVEATTREKLPAGHAKQFCDPAQSLCLPAAHSTQAVATSPKLPGPHSHTATEVLPTGDVARAGHAAHFGLPAMDAYVPAWHFWHLNACGSEYVPVGHVSHGWDPMAGLCLPAAHAVHLLSVAYKPAAHGWHVKAPAVANKPAAHTTHA